MSTGSVVDIRVVVPGTPDATWNKILGGPVDTEVNVAVAFRFNLQSDRPLSQQMIMDWMLSNQDAWLTPNSVDQVDFDTIHTEINESL